MKPLSPRLRTLLPAAAALVLGAALWLSGTRPALLDNGGDALPEASARLPEAVQLPEGQLEIEDGEPPMAAAPAEEPAEGSPFTEEQLAAFNEVLNLVNAAREEAGAEPLELDMALCGAAQTRARECVRSFSHTRPDGSSYKTAITDAGLADRYTGENVATGHTSPQQVVDSWLKSEGHRANILNPAFTRLGVGLEPNSGNRYKGYAWAQLFIA